MNQSEIQLRIQAIGAALATAAATHSAGMKMSPAEQTEHDAFLAIGTHSLALAGNLLIDINRIANALQRLQEVHAGGS